MYQYRTKKHNTFKVVSKFLPHIKDIVEGWNSMVKEARHIHGAKHVCKICNEDVRMVDHGPVWGPDKMGNDIQVYRTDIRCGCLSAYTELPVEEMPDDESMRRLLREIDVAYCIMGNPAWQEVDDA